MDIIVCLKQVPDTETKIKIRGDSKGIETDGIKWIISPYDEFAVEEGLRVKEKHGGTVTLVSLGPQRVVDALRTGLAMGADKAIHLKDESLEGGDSLSTARALAKAIQGVPHDLILTGRQAIDDDAAQLAPVLAELLGIAQATFVAKLEIDPAKKTAVAQRVIEGGAREVLELSLPAVVSVTKGINEPRYASLPGIMKAKQKPIQEATAASLGLPAGEVGAAGAKLKVVGMSYPPERTAGKKIEGEPEAQAKELVRLLREEAKVI